MTQKITKIELEDYNGNTIAIVEVEATLEPTQINIDGFDFADSEDDNWHRFQDTSEDEEVE